MRIAVITVFAIACVAYSSEALFQSRTVSSAGLKQTESQRYQRMQELPGVVRVKLVEVNEAAFSQKNVRLTFFGSEADYSVSKRPRESVWSGRSGVNFDRYVIRKVGSGYSGQLLRGGKQYVLVPVKENVSALYEVRGSHECGMSKIEGALHGH
jgi:hypothetical protein